jgi:hypothetical protein
LKVVVYARNCKRNEQTKYDAAVELYNDTLLEAMQEFVAARSVDIGLVGAYRYQRHRPEQTLLYRIVESNIARRSSSTWPGIAGRCRAMPSGSSRITSAAAVWNIDFCGCVATPATPNTW